MTTRAGYSIDGGRHLEIYRDEGCDLHPSCLACPRAVCVYDDPRGKTAEQEQDRAARDAAVRRALAVGAGRGEVEERFGISRRTLLRIVNGK